MDVSFEFKTLPEVKKKYKGIWVEANKYKLSLIYNFIWLFELETTCTT